MDINNGEQKGSVYLVGAGPGDYRLITYRGYELLQKADVIFYDRLIDMTLLALASSEAVKKYVGKARNNHRFSQQEINNMLISACEKGQNVVRLKGGDPFVFGRGGEEALALKQAGIRFEVVPGISSAVAAPAYAGIPISHRGISSSFHVFTAHDLKRLDFKVLAQLQGTLIFLMGRKNMRALTSLLIEHGKSPDTPSSLVYYGTTSKQKVITGKLKNIAAQGENEGIESPLIIIVGDAVGLEKELGWFPDRRGALAGKRIMITRPYGQHQEIVEEIEKFGGEIFYWPTIEIQGPIINEETKMAVRNAGSYDWIVFNSSNSVRYFFELFEVQKKDIRNLEGVKFAVNGPKTQKALNAHGLLADFMPDSYTASALVNGLQKKSSASHKQYRLLLPRTNIASEDMEKNLAALGFQVDTVRIYRTVQPDISPEGFVHQIRERSPDILTFTSSSTVIYLDQWLSENLNQEKERFKSIPAACIGPVTAETARMKGYNPTVVAEEYTGSGLVKALKKYFSVQ